VTNYAEKLLFVILHKVLKQLVIVLLYIVCILFMYILHIVYFFFCRPILMYVE